MPSDAAKEMPKPEHHLPIHDELETSGKAETPTTALETAGQQCANPEATRRAQSFHRDRQLSPLCHHLKFLHSRTRRIPKAHPASACIQMLWALKIIRIDAHRTRYSSPITTIGSQGIGRPNSAGSHLHHPSKSPLKASIFGSFLPRLMHYCQN